MNPKISKIIHEIRSLFILVIIVLTLKVTIFELYIVPTGSMENTIMTGDFLTGNRFILWNANSGLDWNSFHRYRI